MALAGGKRGKAFAPAVGGTLQALPKRGARQVHIKEASRFSLQLGTTGKTNADVNKRFAEFPTNFASLPNVSLVVPNNLHNAHGSNESPPYATDPSSYVPLRQAADPRQ